MRHARDGAIETQAQLALIRQTKAMADMDAEVLDDVIDTAAMQKVGRQMGSNPAGVYQDERGRQFYVKSLESQAHARNEIIAAKLYQLAGAPTLTYASTKDLNQIATEFVELDKKRILAFERQRAQTSAALAWCARVDSQLGCSRIDGDNQGVIDGVVTTL